MTDDEADRKAISAAASNRLYAFVKSTELPSQVCLDIGIVLGRLSYLEGFGWKDGDWIIKPNE
jgi:hypothetical protein